MENQFDQLINRYGTFSTQWDFIEDRFGVADLLPFSISDMDFELPSGTKNILAQAVEHGVFGYTRWNHPTYKNSVVNWFKRRFNTSLKPEWVVYSPSVIFSLAKFIELYSQKGDKVVTFTPCYDAFFTTVSNNCRILIPCSLILQEDTATFGVDFKKLESIFQKEKPAIFLLCSPHNPTGKVFSEEELELLLELCNQYGVAIISDEIHMDILRKGMKHHPILDYANQCQVPIVLLSSASKSFNIPGLGGSYVICPNEVIRNKFLNILKGQNGLSSIPYLALLAQIDCYENQETWLEELNKYIDKNFRWLKEKLNNNSKINFNIPDASYLAWIDLRQFNFTMDELQKVLIYEEQVAIMRGETYGEEGEMYLRLNLGAPLSKVKIGTEKLLRVISEIS